MQPHLKRAFMLLFIAIIGFIFVRSLIVPETFGQYGWYRGNSVNDLRNLPVEHAGSASCGEESCHTTIYSIWSTSGHKTVNCETCHGASENHVSNVRIMPTPANASRDFCGLCHFKRISRPSDFPQIDPESHGENLQCTYCHNPHKPWFV
ncbi:MAG: multiheme c-type cytochrome [Candidatus Methanoperedens sp.]|nr:multiheme c-type cytochrome [Candidatus Methanoperedens sp.]MCZ7371717.1 multiheme c-type cytochrome [Candidatus Methanoperedens sp.]